MYLELNEGEIDWVSDYSLHTQFVSKPFSTDGYVASTTPKFPTTSFTLSRSHLSKSNLYC